jgi:hypothetical protein
LLGTLTALFHQLRVYARQFESLAGRWEQERFDLLQPDTGGLHHILVLLNIEQLKDVSKSVAHGGGGAEFITGGVVPVGGDMGAET